MAEQLSINLLTALVAAIASTVIGMLWYSPILFGKLWQQLMNMDKKKLAEIKKRGMGGIYFLNFVTTFVMAVVLNYFLVVSPEKITIIKGIVTSFAIWLGFTATIMLGSFLWEGKSIKLYLINVIYQLVSLLVMGIIFGMWL